MTALVRLADRLSRPVALLVTFLLMVGFSILMNAPGLPTSGAEFQRLSGAPAFDFATARYTAEEFIAQTTRAGAEGLAIYRNFMLLDLVFPAIYALFWLGLLARATRSAGSRSRYALLFPVITAAIDYLENLLIAVNLAALPAPSPSLVALASVATQTKFAATTVLLASGVIALLLWWRRAWTTRSGA